MYLMTAYVIPKVIFMTAVSTNQHIKIDNSELTYSYYRVITVARRSIKLVMVHVLLYHGAVKLATEASRESAYIYATSNTR